MKTDVKMTTNSVSTTDYHHLGGLLSSWSVSADRLVFTRTTYFKGYKVIEPKVNSHEVSSAKTSNM